MDNLLLKELVQRYPVPAGFVPLTLHAQRGRVISWLRKLARKKNEGIIFYHHTGC